MSRPPRRRQLPLKLRSEENTSPQKLSDKLSVTSKKIFRVVSPEKSVKKRTTRASKKVQDQDENNVPQNNKSVTMGKIKRNNPVPRLSLHPLNLNSKNENVASSVKSPALRKRSNPSSDSTKNNVSNTVAPTSKVGKITKKLEIPLEPIDRLTSQTDSEEKIPANLKEVQIPKEIEEETGIIEKRATRSGKIMLEKGKNQPPRKSKKFFKTGNANKVTIPVGEGPVKAAGRKKKVVKKTTIDDSTFSPVVAMSDEIPQSKKKNLRPRQVLKNYCEESKILEHLTPNKRNSKVVLQKMPEPNEKKVPIWKSVQFPQPKCEGKDVYDISDGDISNEECKPKKKKRTVRKPVKRLKKTVNFAKPVKAKNQAKLAKPAVSEPVAKVENNVPAISEQVPKKAENMKQSLQIQPKPKMVSMEVLNNAKKISISSASPVPEPVKEFRPFRVTQIFHRRPTMQNSMSDHSLLSKSMSPIARTTENINLATPWRLPPTGSFSCVRNLVQSTPQPNKVSLGTNLLSRRSTLLDIPKMNRIEEDKSEDVQEMPEESIGNRDTILIESSEENNKTPREIIAEEASIKNAFMFGDDEVEDKENAAPNHQSPQKSPRKSPKKSLLATPVCEPKPGPSGLQRQPLREAQILRQTNLNNFLNLDDTPERTEILTPHGIFGDVHSTPISGKPFKKVCEPNIQNAFGFDDDLDASPIASENVKPVPFIPKRVLLEKDMNGNGKQKSLSRNPMRLSTKEILRTLHLRKVKENMKEKQVVKAVDPEKDKQETLQENEENCQKEPEVQKEQEVQKENVVRDFSDTFDLLEEQERQEDAKLRREEAGPLPLFADLEPPTRFVNPPKSQYKRKREVRFSFSEEDDDGEDSKASKERVKKAKKVSKKESKKDQELNEWAKGLNKTFEEIDNFDLIVE